MRISSCSTVSWATIVMLATGQCVPYQNHDQGLLLMFTFQLVGQTCVC